MGTKKEKLIVCIRPKQQFGLKFIADVWTKEDFSDKQRIEILLCDGRLPYGAKNTINDKVKYMFDPNNEKDIKIEWEE